MMVFALLLFAFSFKAIAQVAPDPHLVEFFKHIQSGQKQGVVAYGTSVTKYGAWVSLMEQWFNEKYPGMVTVINSGGPGQNSDWGLAQIQKQVLDHQPDLVFIEFAINDAHVRFKMPVERGKENLDKIVQAIQKQNPKTAIVMQTMNCLWDAPKGMARGDTDRPQMEAYNENYRAYAREHHLPLVDNYPAWLKIKQTDLSKLQELIPDGTHPNKFGSLAVTWPGLKEVLEKAQAAAK